MKKIKVSFGNKNRSNIILRQSPDFSGIWGNSIFLVNQEVEECDFWVVLHGSGLVISEGTNCPSSQIVYASMEPHEGVCSISSSFLEQFSTLISVDRSLTANHQIYKNLHTWWAGLKVVHKSNRHHFSNSSLLSYDDFSSLDYINTGTIFKKDRISVVVSSKKTLPGHSQRLFFLDQLLNSRIGHLVDLFGGGFNPIDDKLDAISSYRYHLVLENTISEDYWTEKLADAFLGSSFPFYSGCTNILDYFPHGSLLSIDITNPSESIESMESAIGSDLFSQSINFILQARDLVLNKYNLLSELDSLLSGLDIIKPTWNQLNPAYFYSDSFPRRIAKKLFFRL